MWRTSPFWFHALLSVSFCVAFFVHSPSLLAEWPQKRYILLCVVFCVMSKTEILLQFNTSWLASLRTWYYLRQCFSFNCSGYDLTLIIKSHILNCYSFLLKFLKNKNSLLVTVVVQFTAKTTNSWKVIYFLSLMSCSINKRNSHM